MHGWIAIDKPVGIGSTQVVATVRRLMDAAKAGHGGTLDPLADGILPIALGEATKTVSFVMDGSKTYRTTIQFGQARSTDDCEGEIIATSDVIPDAAALLAVLPRFTGTIMQLPPAFSALKVDGKRAYDLARAGETVDLKPRQVRIDRIDLLNVTHDRAEIQVQCGKGTYIRSLARDIAQAVGSVGHVATLRRTACGPFCESHAISLDNFKALGQGPALRAYLLPIKTALDDIPALALTQAEARRLHSGQVLPLGSLSCSTQALALVCGSDVRAMDGDRVVALTRIEAGLLRPVRVLNLNPLLTGEDDVDYA